MLEWEEVGQQYVADKEHTRGEMSSKKDRSCCYVSGLQANHLPRRGVGPQSVVSRVG